MSDLGREKEKQISRDKKKERKRGKMEMSRD